MKTLERLPEHSEVLVYGRDALQLRLVVVLVSGLGCHHIWIGAVGLDREFSIGIHSRMYDRRNLECILKDAAHVGARGMPVLHVASEAECEERRLGNVQVYVASHIVFRELELRVEGGSRISRYDSGLIVYAEDEAVAEKFRSSADIGADMRVCSKVVRNQVKPVCRREEVRIDAFSCIFDLGLRELLTHSRKCRSSIDDLHMLRSVYKISDLERIGHTVVCLDVHLCLSDRSAFGLHHDGSVRSAHAINGCR